MERGGNKVSIVHTGGRRKAKNVCDVICFVDNLSTVKGIFT